ncbi:MAG: hypothetical protein M0P12_02975 [Paludibacteraceae bacterium]|nr:hypothetical protein [Paludibacteraceae bacterium]
MEQLDKKEVDLLDILHTFFGYIASFFKLLYKGCIWIIRFIFKNKKKLIFFLVIGFLYSLYESRTDNLNYKANVVMNINIHDAYFFDKLINTLDSYSQNKNKSLLKNALNVSEDNAQSIVSIKSYFFIDKLVNGTPDEVDFEKNFNPLDTMSTIMKDRLYIEVVVKDTTLLKNMTNSFNYYFSCNKLLKEENEIRLKQMDENINSTNIELIKLDSLRNYEYFKHNKDGIANMDKIVLMNEKEKKLYHEEILSLEKKRQDIQWTKEVNSQCVTFTSNFNIDAKPANRLTKSALKYMSIMFVLGFFLSIFTTYKSDIKDFLDK